MLNTKVEPMPTTSGDEEGERRSSKAKTEERLSLDTMFEKCISNATEVSENLPKAVASELNTIIKRIDDIHFRLQIWGSEVGANARRQFTFDDILKLKDSALPEIVQPILESFQQQFSTIGEILKEFLSDSGKTRPRKTFDDLFQELRAAIDVVSGLVQDLVGLSNSLRMEQALQKNEGPYDDMRKEIQRTKDSFQDCTFPNNAKAEFQSKNPVKESPGERPDAWAKRYILTLDGGGVRALSSVLILREILRAVAVQELAIDSEATSSYSPLANSKDSQQPMEDELSKWLPCHYFDYIAGTSSGGLFAIMLGRLQMSVTDCFREIVSLNTKVFGNRHWMHALSIPKYITPKYNHKELENAIKDFIRSKNPPANSGQQMESEVAYASDQHMCRTIVLAYQQDKDSGAPYVFRSYDHRRDLSTGNKQTAGSVRNPGPATDVPIWQVARATSAAPLYFPKMKIGENTFLDGGMGSNNPTMETVKETLYLGGEAKEAIGFVLSIGTGSRPLPASSTNIGSTFIRSFQHSVNETLSSERTHEVTKFYASQSFTYKRFNVQNGLGDIKLDEWKIKKNRNITLDQIEAATTDYLQQPSVQAELKETAKILVENRRKRSQTPRWRSFCLGEEGQK